MAHRNAVADGYSIKLKGDSARFANCLLDHLCYLIEVNVTGHNLTEAVCNTDKRLFHIQITDTAGMKKCAVRRTLKSFLDHIAFHNQVSPKKCKTS